ncbi:hypothetical protein D187_008046 [Cystobacter fuscus DSM 2262]|uniref:Uncharacterized protein n=1 Tax=Cystobacter fuscus (strain ATCC 25194 / DSM 2262 / NBRC 100088 / M29) TaxID=1242864 RepID=S9Q5W6_CYSF2|nr:hypothetical protein [Cystobacter fuscus]EPX56704.1 hypothetical protein D187_008046 [Cystobacter fuscus DSM 2262]
MKLIQPDAEMLRAYVQGELTPGETEGVRHWLIVHADEAELEAYEKLLQQRQRREALLEYWTSHPALARLEWSWAKVRRKLATRSTGIGIGTSSRPMALASLGSPTRDSPREQTLEVAPGEPLDYEVRPATACYVAVYALEPSGALHPLHVGDRLLSAGTPLSLKSIEFMSEDEGPLELFIISDDSAPLPSPGTGDGAEWLAALVESIPQQPGRSALRRTLKPSQPGGKQS